MTSGATDAAVTLCTTDILKDWLYTGQELSGMPHAAKYLCANRNLTALPGAQWHLFRLDITARILLDQEGVQVTCVCQLHECEIMREHILQRTTHMSRKPGE